MRKAINDLCYGRAAWPLFLTGPAGTGKTCAALALVDRVTVDGHCIGQYAEYGELCRRLIAAMKGELPFTNRHGYSGYTSVEDVWEEWRRAPLSVLDEIGARENVSDHAYETLKRAIDSRESQPAVFISNLNLEGIAGVYDDRIASRLGAGTALELSGPDRRLG